jgi:hypothetical protein
MDPQVTRIDGRNQTMKKMMTGFLALGLALTGACGDGGTADDGDDGDDGDDAPPPDGPENRIHDVPAGDITADTTWLTDHTYILKGQVFVTGGTLTIQAGARVEGDAGSVLVISTGGNIEARGTAAQPIVFTSSAITPAPGDWGGIVMLGTAGINVAGGTERIEGFPDTVGPKVTYGSATPNDADDCGTLVYARVEFAGFALAPDNELNGIGVGGCGTGTEIDYVQVHAGLDDGIEMFGGTANLEHLVISQAADDSLDWDFGWRGTAQWIIAQQSATRGERGIEADNSEAAPTATPISDPFICNMTFVGGEQSSQTGAFLRRGTRGQIHNSIFVGVAAPVDVNGNDSAGQVPTGEIQVKASFFYNGANPVYPAAWDENAMMMQDDCPGGTCVAEETVFGQDPTNNIADPMLNAAATSITAPVFAPVAGSPALTRSAPPTPCDATATYAGAVGATDWTSGWTAYPTIN